MTEFKVGDRVTEHGTNTATIMHVDDATNSAIIRWDVGPRHQRIALTRLRVVPRELRPKRLAEWLLS